MVKVITLGCRMNAYESEVIKEKLQHIDNLIIINTCAVTGEAERQCRQTIRKLAKENPQARIVVTGCAAQIAPQKFAALPEVDLVLGNIEKNNIDKILSSEPEEKTIVGDISSYGGYDDYLITGFEGRQKAFMQIQQGCDHRCTYCIVPYARGRNRSVPEADIIAQINTLLQQGFAKICLTGVDICSYQPSFVHLVEHILAQTAIPQLDFGSLDPAALNDEFVDILRIHPNIGAYLHFSVQSGDNLILKRMKRRHSREDVINLCRKIKAVRPDIILGADFICGFPTETVEQFNNTLKLVDEAGLSKLHVFPYSERLGTPAALMPQIPMDERRRRAEILRQKGENADV